MAQLNITLNQEEILQLLRESSPDAFKNLLQESLNGVLKAESAEQLRAEPYERTEERTDSRNGTRDRPLVTRLGRIELKVPRHRNVPFKTLVFDNYKRSGKRAFHEVYPDVPWQRCQAHFTRNIVDGAPKFLRAGLRSELKEMFNCEKVEQARARRDEIIADYTAKAPKAMERLDAGFEEAMTVMLLPKDMRKCTRTSNYLERLNKEIKRRSNVIGIFPNAGSAVRLLGALLMEENDRWASMKKIYYISANLELKKKAQILIDLARQQCLLAKAA